MLKSLLAGAAALAVAATAHAETYAIQAGRLIVDASQPARANSPVIVENGRIASIHAANRTVTSSLLPCRGGRKIISRLHCPWTTRSSFL